MRLTIQVICFSLIILVISLFVLIHARSFFVPIAFAAVLAMLLTPIAGWLEGKRWPPSLSALASVLIILLVIAAITLFVRWQLTNLLDNTDQIEQELGRRYQELRKFIADSFGISLKEQEKIIDQQGGSAGKSTGSLIATTVSGLGSFLTQFLLTLVYVFLFIYFRKKLHQFALEITPPAKRESVDDALENSRKVAQHYLGGMALMVMLLWVMYGIGF
ncbi:MAG TPA: AI-2E family transporter, partial [Chitinophagaceae bacterium]|nr:AI-2E family transporter [Chitinophagaceae bacterium]